jgi:hypothetical protein
MTRRSFNRRSFKSCVLLAYLRMLFLSSSLKSFLPIGTTLDFDLINKKTEVNLINTRSLIILPNKINSSLLLRTIFLFNPLFQKHILRIVLIKALHDLFLRYNVLGEFVTY